MTNPHPPAPPMPPSVPAFKARLAEGGHHDGDTTVFLMDNWFQSRQEEAIRYANVAAPETSPMQPGGAETRDLVNTWLHNIITRNSGQKRPLKWPFRILTQQLTTGPEPNQRRTLTRYVGWVYDATTGACLNDDVNAFLRMHPEWPTGKTVDQALLMEVHWAGCHDPTCGGCLPPAWGEWQDQVDSRHRKDPP